MNDSDLNLYKTLSKIVTELTGLNVRLGKTIFINSKEIIVADESYHLLIHEIGHVLSCPPDRMNIPNYGMDFVFTSESKRDPTTAEYLEDDIASEVSRILFEDIIKSSIRNRDHLDYFSYLMDIKFPDKYQYCYTKEDINNMANECLTYHLKRLNLTLESAKNIISENFKNYKEKIPVRRANGEYN